VSRKRLGRANGGLVLRVWALPVLALICAVPWAVIRLVMRRPVRRAAIEALFVGYVGLLLYVVLLPLPVRPDDARFVWASVNLVPARTVVGIIRDFPGLVIQQLLGNVVMFVPLGFLLPLLSTRYRRFAMTAAVGLSASVGIELVQLAMRLTLISRRSVDVDDVILNVTGACLGYLVWRGAYALARPFAQRSGALKDAT
jgi:glycopeptide antibiotics resistance protein